MLVHIAFRAGEVRVFVNASLDKAASKRGTGTRKRSSLMSSEAPEEPGGGLSTFSRAYSRRAAATSSAEYRWSGPLGSEPKIGRRDEGTLQAQMAYQKGARDHLPGRGSRARKCSKG